MDKTDPPTSFGVFRPVGSVLMAFEAGIDPAQIRRSLLDAGFDASAITVYSAAEMIAQVQTDEADASPLVSLGKELDAALARKEMAERGCNFVVVETPQDEDIERVREIALQFGAVQAQHFGRLITEELVPQSEI